MARRGKGEGSIFRRNDGLWAGSVTIGYGPDGAQRKKWVYGQTRRTVADKLAKLMSESGSRLVSAPERATVAEWLTRFAELHGADKAPRTRENYQHYLARVLPQLGHVPLRRLTPLQLRAFFSQLTLSPSVRQHIFDFLNRAMKDAVRLEMIDRNPLDAADRPRGGAQVEPKVWTSDEARRFLQAAEGHRLYPACYLLLALGLRLGELLALRWADWEGDRLHVRHSLAVVDNRTVFGPPKNRRTRTLYLPQGVQLVLAQRQADQTTERDLAAHWEDYGLIFSSTVGTPTNPNNFRRTFKGLIARAAVPRIRVHDNRHTWVTLARDAGLDVEVVAERAGHDPRMTILLYSKVTDERKRKAAIELEELLGTP